MGLIQPDFSEAVDFTPVPIGVYKARVAGAESQVSKNGNNMVVWKFQIQGAEGDFAQYNNRIVFHRTMTAGKGSGKLKEVLEASLGEARAFEPEEVLGRDVTITINHRKSEDGATTYEDVRSVRKA